MACMLKNCHFSGKSYANQFGKVRVGLGTMLGVTIASGRDTADLATRYSAVRVFGHSSPLITEYVLAL